MRAPAARRAVPGPAMEWVGGSRRVGAVTGFAGVGRPAPGVGRPWGATSGSPSTMELPPAASGCFLGLRARAGRRGRRRWSVCEVAARGELSCRQTTTSRGDPHTEGFAGPREWIVGVAGPTPVYRRSPLFWGRSWGRVVPCGAQAAVRRTRAREGVDPVTVVLHYGRYQAPGRCRTDVIRLPEGSRILGAGRPPSGGQDALRGLDGWWWGRARYRGGEWCFSRSGGVIGGMGGHGGLCRPFRCLPVDRIGAIRGDRYEPGNHWLRIREPLQRLFLRGGRLLCTR